MFLVRIVLVWFQCSLFIRMPMSSVPVSAMSVTSGLGQCSLLFDIMGLVFQKVGAIGKFPIYISGFVNFSDACFKNQRVGNSGMVFGFDNGIKTDAPVGKMSDNRNIVSALVAFAGDS